MISDLTELTIIIPTRDRPKYLHRALSYYDSFGLNLKIIVADSSLGTNKDKNIAAVKQFKKLQILLLNDFAYETPPYLKCLDALKKVKTNYSIFGADDDFHSVKGLAYALSYLKSNLDYVAVEGENVFVSKIKSFFFWKPGDVFLSLEDSNVLSRMKNHSLYYQPTFYTICKTNFFIYLFNQAANTNSLEYPFGEFQPSFLTVIKGKVKRLNVIYSYRDHTDDFHWDDPPTNLIQKYKDDGTFRERYLQFKNVLVKELSNGAGISERSADKFIDKCLLRFFKKQETTKPIKLMKKVLGHSFLYYLCVKIYLYIKWLRMDLKRYWKLRILLRNNPEFKKVKYFIMRP
jgi:glycosyltransferase domain-containing protein